MKIIYEREVQRILFIVSRDGIDAAIEFAKRGIKTYRTGVLHTKKRYNERASHLSVSPYKEYAILSYLQYKDFLKSPLSYL